MKQGLSKREKILLGILILVGMLYLSIQFLILPLVARYMDDIQERNTLTTERARVDENISIKELLVRENEDAGQRFEAIKQEYPLLIPNEEIDTFLTNLCFKNYLRPTSLNIAIPTAPTPPPPPAEGVEGEEGTQEPVEGLFTIVTATMQLTGTYNALGRLVEEVDAMQHVRITNLSFTANQSEEDPSDIGRISLDFELTYVNP